MAKRRIAWTGGFDSTWLVVDALLAGDDVETVAYHGYGIHPGKITTETSAQERIKRALPAELMSRLSHSELRSFDRRAFGDAWGELWGITSEVNFAGWNTQNPMLAGLAKDAGPIEVAHVAEDKGARFKERWSLLEKYGISFPVANISKRELLADAQSRRFDHLLAMTWSCEEPVAFVACGACEPCEKRIISQIYSAGDGRR